jgi:L-alanine-DL-glutamate epimerase-like enolase superfamily enzyme
MTSYTAIESINVSPLTLPLRSPFRIAKRTAYEAINSFVEIVATDYSAGFGSAAPVEYVTGETIDTVSNAIMQSAPLFIGCDASRIGLLLDIAHESLAESPSARTAMEIALYDLWAQQHGINLFQFFGGRLDALESDLTISIVPPDEAENMVREALSEGFSSFKVKTGCVNGIESDLERIRTVHKTAPKAGIRIDANQAYSVSDALLFCKRVAAEFGDVVELIEQPVDADDIDGLCEVKAASSIPIFADEAVKTPSQCRELIRRGAVDGVNIKLMKSGITGALELIEICRQAEIKMMIGCMLESRLSLTVAAFIAAGTGSIGYIDLDAYRLISPGAEQDGGFSNTGSKMRIDPTSPGWGWSRIERREARDADRPV